MESSTALTTSGDKLTFPDYCDWELHKERIEGNVHQWLNLGIWLNALTICHMELVHMILLQHHQNKKRGVKTSSTACSHRLLCKTTPAQCTRGMLQHARSNSRTVNERVQYTRPQVYTLRGHMRHGQEGLPATKACLWRAKGGPKRGAVGAADIG